MLRQTRLLLDQYTDTLSTLKPVSSINTLFMYFAVLLFKEWVYIDSRWRTLPTNHCSMLRQTRLLLNQYTDTLSTLKPVSSINTLFMYFAVLLFKEWVYIDSRWRTLPTNHCSMLRQTRLLLDQYTDTLSTLKPVSSINTLFMYFAVLLFKEWVYIDSRWRTLPTNHCSMLRQTRLLLNQYTDTLSTLKPVSSINTLFILMPGLIQRNMHKIGYIRLLLLLGSLLLYENPNVFLGLYIVSVILDAVDGIVARKLNQTSVFGAWFDVVIDLISRGSLWCFISRWGYFVMMIEWLTFIATHTRGPNWKIPDEEFPWICKKVMANGFKTATGSYAITGIFVLPLWIYGIQSGFLKDTIKMPIIVQYLLCAFLVVGRLLAFTAEGFFIWQHIKAMVLEEEKLKQRQETS